MYCFPEQKNRAFLQCALLLGEDIVVRSGSRGVIAPQSGVMEINVNKDNLSETVHVHVKCGVVVAMITNNGHIIVKRED